MEINTVALILFLIGLGFMVGEMFTPGLGVMGLLSVLCIIAAVIVQAKNLTEGLILMAGALVLTTVMLFVTLRSVDKGKISKSDNLVLKSEIEEKGNDFSAYFNMKGVADSDLRPSGTAIINNKRMDVVAEGTYIAKGSAIYVSDVDGMRIIVKGV